MKEQTDRKSTRLNSSHLVISYAVFCLKKKNVRQLVCPPTQLLSHIRTPRTPDPYAATGGGGIPRCVIEWSSRGARYEFFFFFNDTATTEIYPLALHDALPI